MKSKSGQNPNSKPDHNPNTYLDLDRVPYQWKTADPL